MAVTERLRDFVLGEEKAAELREQLLAWINGTDRENWQRSLDLRIDQARQRLDRLTDLLIDGTIPKVDFENKKHSLLFEIAELTEERRKLDEDRFTEEDTEKFLELATSLDSQYKSASNDEKRTMVENCFSNRTLSPKSLCLEPRNWLRDLKNGLAVPDGDQPRSTSRTSSLPETLTAMTTMLSPRLTNKHPKITPIAPLGISQWKYNLKNQKLDDLQNQSPSD